MFTAKLFHQKTTPSSSKQSFQVAAGETVRKFFSFGSVSFGISSEWIMFDLEDCTAASLEVESGPSTTVSHLHSSTIKIIKPSTFQEPQYPSSADSHAFPLGGEPSRETRVLCTGSRGEPSLLGGGDQQRAPGHWARRRRFRLRRADNAVVVRREKSEDAVERRSKRKPSGRAGR